LPENTDNDTFYSGKLQPSLQMLPLEQEAIAQNTTIVTSLPYKDNTGKLYNSVLVLGNERGMYKKIHLLPFGEYLPWQPVSGYLLGLMNVRLGRFSPGEMNQPLLKVNPLIGLISAVIVTLCLTGACSRISPLSDTIALTPVLVTRSKYRPASKARILAICICW
jgi:hypothetical protein